MKILTHLGRRLRRGAAFLYDVILHYTVFHRQLGDVAFYGLDEPGAMDGHVIMNDLHFKRTVVYGYRFDNSYLRFATAQQRCAAVWKAAMLHDGWRPLATIEHNCAYTPYGSYDSVPVSYARLLQTAHTEALSV